MDRLFLKHEYLQMLIDIFNSYCPKAEIWAFGCRIRGEAHDGSDLDLAVKKFNCPDKNIYKLRELINDSDIPIIVEILDFNNIPSYIQDEIMKDCIVIFPCDSF